MITLTYSGNVLELPSAKLGEPLNLKSGLKIHYTMTGKPYTYSVGSSRSWTLTIDNMKDTDVVALRAWLAGYTGQDVTYVDHLSNSYTVHLVSPTLTVTQSMDCLFNTILELRIKNA
jgi:hypothetical protein